MDDLGSTELQTQHIQTHAADTASVLQTAHSKHMLETCFRLFTQSLYTHILETGYSVVVYLYLCDSIFTHGNVVPNWINIYIY